MEPKLIKVEVIDPFFIEGKAKEIGDVLELDSATALTLASANRVKLVNLADVKKRAAKGE